MDDETPPPPAAHVEVYDARLPEPCCPSPSNATVLLIFACRIGPITVQGARLMDRANASLQVYMPRCRGSGDHVTVSDAGTRRALKAAAKRAYTRLIAGEDADAHP